MRWPRGRFNGERIVGFKLVLIIDVSYWRVYVAWHFGNPVVRLGPLMLRAELMYDGKRGASISSRHGLPGPVVERPLTTSPGSDDTAELARLGVSQLEALNGKRVRARVGIASPALQNDMGGVSWRAGTCYGGKVIISRDSGMYLFVKLEDIELAEDEPGKEVK